MVDGQVEVEIEIENYLDIFDHNGEYMLLICDAGAECIGGVNTNSIVTQIVIPEEEQCELIQQHNSCFDYYDEIKVDYENGFSTQTPWIRS